MKDVEQRLLVLETPSTPSILDEQLTQLKERMRPVMKDIERRLVALEIRPTESALSNVTFAEEQSPLPITTLIERIQVLESKVNNLEPSLSTLHSFISSTPLEPPEGTKKEDGPSTDPASGPSSTQDQALQRRNENLEAWVKSYSGGIYDCCEVMSYHPVRQRQRTCQQIST